MAAEMEGCRARPFGRADQRGVFKFKMPQAIPSVSDRDCHRRSRVQENEAIAPGVWAEPSVVDAAAREFEDTEKMITPPSRSTDRTGGDATTCWCFRRHSPSAAWRTRG
jgi:hypothetical protein